MKKEYFSIYPYAELISQNGQSKLRFCTYGYAFPDATNPYDADWHRNYFSLILPAFRVDIDDIILEGKLLNYFLNSLREFSALKKEEVILRPTEPYFEICLAFNRKRNIEVSGKVEYPLSEYSSTLKFNFLTDLTFIDKFISGINSILNKFPPRK